MKLSINFKKLSFLKNITSNVSILLWAFLGLTVLMVGWIVYGELGKVKNTQTDQNAINSQIVRVNLAKHKELEKKLNDNANFQPRPIAGSDAFGYPPEVKGR